MRMRTIGAIGALLLVVSGCGGSNDEDAKKAIAESIMNESDTTFDVKQSEADCVASGFVDDIGVDQLQEYGILTEDAKTSTTLDEIKMSADDADAAANAFVDCVDVQELLMGSVPLEGMDPAAVDCVKGVLSDDAVHDLLAATFSAAGADAAAPDMTEALQKCVLG